MEGEGNRASLPSVWVPWRRVPGALIAAFGLAASGADFEWGGHISGSGSNTLEVLRSLSGRPGLHWTRGASPLGKENGFRWLADVRNYQPGRQRPPERLPQDLFSVYWTCRTNLPPAPRSPDAWEVYNEPDFYFVENSAADMAAVLKAAWWAIKTDRPEVPVLMPSLAFRPARYALELAHNGLASWTDGLNLHYYGWAADFTDFLAHHRVFARAAGIEGPWWLTEIGYFQLPVTLASDPGHLDRQAAFHERTLVESWAEGVERHFPFLLTHYVEVISDFGLTDPEGRWRPALLAIVQLAGRIPGCRPLWSLVHEPTGARIGLVIEEPDGAWWSVLWSPGRPRELAPPGRVMDPPVPERLRLEVTWPEGTPFVHFGLDSGVLLDPAQLPAIDLAPERTFHLRTGPAPYQLAEVRWEPFRRELGAPPRIAPDLERELDSLPPRREPSPVVLRLRMSDAWTEDKPRQSLRLAAETKGDARLELRNFTDRPVRGTWRIDAPEGWSAGPATGGEARPDREPGPSLGGSVEVAPLARLDIPVRFTRRPDLPSEPRRVRLTWRDEAGRVDAASVRFEPDLPPPPIWRRYTARDLVPRAGQHGATQIFQIEPDRVAIEVRQPGDAHRDAMFYLALPGIVRGSDVFTTRIHAEPGPTPTFAQAFLFTAHGEVWRHGELESVPADGLAIRAGLGEFAPTIWSRHRDFGAPAMAEARWLAIRFQGLAPGQLVELEEPALRRME
ncbi:MAG: hypothetical protein KF833_16865 [Verrucomicrobiae bacterium]|nr:hypothetical protein [Verrucomicrobiae bacterium]